MYQLHKKQVPPTFLINYLETRSKNWNYHSHRHSCASIWTDVILRTSISGNQKITQLMKYQPFCEPMSS